MNPTAVKVLWWIGSAVLIVAVIAILVVINGWPLTYLD